MNTQRKPLTETRLARKGTTECIAVLVRTSPRARTIGVNRPDGTPLGHLSKLAGGWSAFRRRFVVSGDYVGTAATPEGAAALLVADDEAAAYWSS